MSAPFGGHIAQATHGEREDLALAGAIASVIAEESEGGAACGWLSCSGCHETNEGQETGHYPYSDVFKCFLGSGCSECGGIGAVWIYYSEADLAAMQQDTPTRSALDDIAAERQRQQEAEGWTPEHDDEHSFGQLATAAACYLRPDLRHAETGVFGTRLEDPWPWWNTHDDGGRTYHREKAWWKPTSRRRDLVKAGALIVAEIERLDRAEAAKASVP